MSAFLADGNVLIALTVVDHIHHEVAINWFESSEPELATCPITEGTLLRFLIRAGRSASDAAGVLDAMRSQPWHHFWPDVLPFDSAVLTGVIGHRQVTDSYLVALARHRGERVATLDKGLVLLHGDEGAVLVH